MIVRIALFSPKKTLGKVLVGMGVIFNYSESQILIVYLQIILQLFHLLVLVLPLRYFHHHHHLHPDLGIVP
jgi:hypothetical protein